MDGDNTAKSFEQGANSALKESEMSSGIHESVKQTVSSSEPSPASTDALMLWNCSPQQVKRPQGLELQCFLRMGLWDLCSTVWQPPRKNQVAMKYTDTGHSRWSHWWNCSENWWPT